ncbi:MAG: glycosyltransferase family 4 protein, partial [Chloroflexota bacterium]|nr:glycosyltransferase family 4 protein [Chloroflexota bacterium]
MANDPLEVQALTIRHLVPGLGRVPRDLTKEGLSGLVASVLGIARAQVARGYHVALHGWRPAGASDGPRRYELDGVAVHVTPGWPWARTRRVDGRVLAPLLAMSARSAAADIVSVHSDPHLLLAPRARARVLHYHTPVPAVPAGLYRRLVQQADLVVCCSEFVRRQVLARLEFPPERVAVVRNGVDLERFQERGTASAWSAERQQWGVRPDEMVLLYVGAVVPEKGLLHLLRALRQVHQEHPCRLVVVGAAGLWPTPDNPHPDGADAYSASVRMAGKDLP